MSRTTASNGAFLAMRFRNQPWNPAAPCGSSDLRPIRSTSAHFSVQKSANSARSVKASINFVRLSALASALNALVSAASGSRPHRSR